MKKTKSSRRTILYEAHFTPEQEVYAELCVKARIHAWNYVRNHLESYYLQIDKGVIDPYDEAQYFDFNDLSKQMTIWRKSDPVMNQVPRHVMGSAIIDIKNAHWSHLMKPKKRGRPRFKDYKNSDEKKTFQLFKLYTGKPVIRQINGRYGEMRLSNVFKWVKMSLGPDWNNPGICTVTVRKYEDKRWRIIVVWEAEDPKRHKGDDSCVGIDIGSDHALSLSNGDFYDVPVEVEKLDRKRRAFQAKLERKQEDSNRYCKTDWRKRTFEIRKSRAAKAWIDRTVFDISSRYDTVFVEDINLTELAEGDWGNNVAKGNRKSYSKRNVNRKMKQAQLGLFRSKLKEKTNVVAVPSYYTSQDCPSCGHRDENNRDKSAFKCTACGRTAHADVNAATNILKRGIILVSGHDTASVKERIRNPKSNLLATEQRLAEALKTGVFKSRKLIGSSSNAKSPEEVLQQLPESMSSG